MNFSERKVWGIILAAGASSRMGCAKLLLPWREGKTVLSAVIDNAQVAGLDGLVLVSGAWAKETETIAASMGVTVVHNPSHKLGMSTSLAAGIRALPEGVAALFLLGDMPEVSPTLIHRVAAAYRENADIVAPRLTAGRQGHPVLFGPKYFEELLAQTGDQGGRAVLASHAEEIHWIETFDDGCLLDIDDAESYRKYLQEKE